MMVDNSIVVLESCFRATAEQEDKGGAWLFFSSASRNRHCHQLDHRFDDHDLCRIPAAGILKRYDRQMFKPLGFTIVFCMSASLLSAMTVVPLCYLFYKPSEAKRALMGRPIERFTEMVPRHHGPSVKPQGDGYGIFGSGTCTDGNSGERNADGADDIG